MSDEKDYKDTVFLPKTDFPMKAGLPQKEPGILAKWQEADLYGKLRAARAGREKFIFHDGPPYANGDIHIGHALNKTLKDLVVRTQSLLGKDAPFVPGWDCHGLPIEWKIEEQYRKKKRNKDEVPPKEFRAECRQYAQNWVNVQSEQFQRLGINADWKKPYLTMDFDSEATIVSELLKFAESGQLYRGAKPVMWSPVEKTALAEAEVEYEDITSTQIDVAFEIVESPIPELVGAHAVIWTTTPWTIPVNQAIAYGPDVEYVLVDFERKVRAPFVGAFAEGHVSPPNRQLLVAKELVGQIVERIPVQQERVLWQGKGSDLAGTIAKHPMADTLRHASVGWHLSQGEDSRDGIDPSLRWGDADWSEETRTAAWERAVEFFTRPRPFLPGDFVTTDSGTGLVHMAPDHGEDDFDLCKAQVPPIQPVYAVGADGRYRDDWAWMGGDPLSVINNKLNAPDGPICSALKEAGALLSARNDESTRHSYPHSWRSKAKVIYRCTPQWFVPMDKNLSPLQGGEGSSVAAERGGATLSSTAQAESPHSQDSPPSLTLPPEGERGLTLRQKAMAAIHQTRFVPEKGRNRIGSMVEGRPDWVLSRQRAWGVPITLFVDRKTGQYLNDPAVNARIIAAVKEQGVDAWEEARAQEFLGSAYNADDYEMITDILDVWFDSGCTHVFTLESGKWPDQQWPADLYLEGSDQHRGWFQSSLLESCGTRGRAPYNAVLTHGFTMDAKGMKMSKSLGNTVDPLKVMQQYGADIIRLWVASIDYTEDHRIGDEILRGVGDQYRKLRNTFRYMLGALEGFDESERVAVEDMPELERYVLHLLADLDGKLRSAVKEFDFNSYMRLLSEFANEDLSAFFFDIRKDCLYCDVNPATGTQTDKRRAYRSVLDILFHAMIRYAAPVLVFTAEEVWSTRFPDAESVHLLEWPEVDAAWRDGELHARWSEMRDLREKVTEAIEPLRREKIIRSSLEAELVVPEIYPSIELDELFISGVVTSGGAITVTKTTHHKCGRCWRHLPEVAEDGALCDRCHSVLAS